METLVGILQDILLTAQNIAQSVLAAEPTSQILVLLCLILVFLLVLIARSFSKRARSAPILADEAAPHPDDKVVLTPQQSSGSNEAQAEGRGVEMENVSDLDDFKIFKRSVSAELKAQPQTAQPMLPADDELLVIEQNMVRLRELFHEGHITRDVYIDETRTLYHQAKALVKIA